MLEENFNLEIELGSVNLIGTVHINFKLTETIIIQGGHQCLSKIYLLKIVKLLLISV